MYALSNLQHILRRPASCRQLPLLSHRHPPKLGDLFRPSLTNRVPCSFAGVAGQNGTRCLIVHITRAMRWRNVTFVRNIETLPLG
jgi:hypothetical protein